MTPLVNSAFVAWTYGLDPLLARISIFEHIRDIPYSLAMPMTDPMTAPEQLLRTGRGYCGPKHFLLAEMYRNLGLDVRYVTVAFSWNDPDIHYPPGLGSWLPGSRQPITSPAASGSTIAGCWWMLRGTFLWEKPGSRLTSTGTGTRTQNAL